MYQQVNVARSFVNAQTRAHRYFVVMRYEQTLLVAAFSALLFGACRKEPDNDVPRITITSLSGGSWITVPDTLVVTVEATDDINLQQVGITLLDQQFIPVVSAASAAVSGKYITRSLELPIISQQLLSGDYQLRATAWDGSLTGTDFHTVHVSGVPLRVRAVFTVAETDDGTVALYRTDSLEQTSMATSWTMDFAGAAVSSASQRIFIAGGTNGDLLALEPDGLTTVWQQPNLSPASGTPWFTGVDLCTDGRLYVGRNNGVLQGFLASNGTGAFIATVPEPYRPEQVAVAGGLVVCAERHIVTQQWQLAFHYPQSGALQQIQPLDLLPVRMFDRDGAHLLLFGNRNGQGVVQDRTINGGGSWEPYHWPSEITAVERVGTDVWLVALASGSLQRFTYNNAGSLVIATTPVLTTMAYDAVNGQVYGGTYGQVLQINPTTGATAPAWPVTGTVRKVLPLLNR